VNTRNGRSVPRAISALAARTQFGQIMRRASQKQERFVVDRRGRPEVVIMGVEDFLKTIVPEARVLAAIRTEAKRSRKSTLTMRQIDQEIAAFRRERRLRNVAPERRS
jgi:prevent-host-death family protein